MNNRDWVNYAAMQDRRSNAAMWQVCRGCFKHLSCENGDGAQELALRLNRDTDTIAQYADAYQLWALLLRCNRDVSVRGRRVLRYSHFVALAKAGRNGASLAQIVNLLQNAIGAPELSIAPLSVRELRREIEKQGEHVLTWAGYQKRFRESLVNLLALPDLPPPLRPLLQGIMNLLEEGK